MLRKVVAMFCNFAPRHDMRAHELSHTAMAAMPLHIASLITKELGEPSFRKNADAAWYADACIDLDDGSKKDVPFALRVDRNGNCSLTVPWEAQQLMSDAIASLVPAIYIEMKPRGSRAA